jgi:hypothetical protein
MENIVNKTIFAAKTQGRKGSVRKNYFFACPPRADYVFEPLLQK